jgi:hypothetical protein
MKEKKKASQKVFQDNAHNQGSKKVPMPQVKEYGTGSAFKKAAPSLAKKMGINKGK